MRANPFGLSWWPGGPSRGGDTHSTSATPVPVPREPSNLVQLPYSDRALAGYVSLKLRRLAVWCEQAERLGYYGSMLEEVAEMLEQDFSVAPPGAAS